MLSSKCVQKVHSPPSLVQHSLYSTSSDGQSDIKSTTELSHIDQHGDAHMVDIGHKSTTKRQASAWGKIILNHKAFQLVKDCRTSHKGSVLGVAQLAGIMAAKQTSLMIPLCHNIPLTSVEVMFRLIEDTCAVEACACVKCDGMTGCEMEAITAVCVALLTVYDMTKSISKEHVISDIRLVEKTGGKSGHFRY